MKKLHSCVAVVFVSASALAAQAAETEYNFTWCGHNKSTMLTASPNLMIWTDNMSGIVSPSSSSTSTTACWAFRPGR